MRKGGERLGVFSWWKSKFIGTDMQMCETLTAEILYKKLALETCIDLIANSILRTEFITYKDGKKERGRLFYQLNVRPNKNQNQKEFLKEIVRKLITTNECLVIQTDDGDFLIADSFIKDPKAVISNYYSQITVNGLTFPGNYRSGQVFYFKYSNENLNRLISGMNESFGKLITASMNMYKRSNAKRYVMTGEFFRRQDDKTQEAVDAMITNQMKPWLEADNAGAIFQLQNKYDLKEMTASGKGQTGQTSKDIQELIEKIYELVARTLHVPIGLLKGDVVDLSGQMDSLLAFVSLPIVDLIVTEMNGTLYTEQEYLNRTYIKADTTKLKIISLTDLSTSLDKFISIGAFCIDDVIEFMGGEPFNEEWSKRRFITKNYADAANLDETEGG